MSLGHLEMPSHHGFPARHFAMPWYHVMVLWPCSGNAVMTIYHDIMVTHHQSATKDHFMKSP
jgi:hypothetical protein